MWAGIARVVADGLRRSGARIVRFAEADSARAGRDLGGASLLAESAALCMYAGGDI